LSIVRLTGQLLDDERTCVVDGRDSLASVEPYQVELPEREAELRRKAEAYERLAKEARDEADAIRAEIESAQSHAYICGGHRSRLPKDVIGRWTPVASLAGLPAAGRLVAEPGSKVEAEAIAEALDALDANPPRYREPRPTPTRNVHRQRRASPLAGV
jgi:hypothetical protein